MEITGAIIIIKKGDMKSMEGTEGGGRFIPVLIEGNVDAGIHREQQAYAKIYNIRDDNAQDLMNIINSAIQSKDNFFKIFFNSPVAMAMATLSEHRISKVNKEFLHLTEFSYDELIDIDLTDTALWSSIEKNIHIFEILIDKGIVKNIPMSIRTKSGKKRDIIMSAEIINYDNTDYILTSSIDITERNNLKKELSFQNELLRKVLDSIPVMTLCRDKEGKFKWANKEWRRVLGFSDDKINEYDVLEKLYPDTNNRKCFFNFINTAENIWENFKTCRNDGTFIDAVWSRIILSDGSNIIIGIDNTTISETQRELINAKEYMIQILNCINDPIIIKNEQRSIVFANKAQCSITGKSREEILGKTAYDIFYEEAESSRKQDDFVLNTGQECIDEKQLTDSDGNIRIYEVRKKLFKDNFGNNQIFEMLRDITAKNKVIEALGKIEKDLKEKTDSLEELDTALKVLLKYKNDEKKEFENIIITNFKKLVKPYLEKLKRTHLNSDQVSLLGIIESNLDEITSPFLNALNVNNFDLTPREIQIMDLIKDGLTTKEISTILNTSTKSVDFHRCNIRKKFNLRKNINLRAYLSKLS
ncbi:MAG: aerobic respiration control sensor protein ArcB [Smithella sp. PtaU1.Bin162]|nr:MAG: aerobic respiration control sensor protein ArcB [Smithella sp. PtaU1.Bin162]